MQDIGFLAPKMRHQPSEGRHIRRCGPDRAEPLETKVDHWYSSLAEFVLEWTTFKQDQYTYVNFPLMEPTGKQHDLLFSATAA